MTAGDRRSLSPALRAAYSRSGTSHLLAVSGLHVGIVFLLANLLLWWLPLFRHGHILRNIAVILLIWLYAATTGFPPSVVRAALMFSVLQFALASSSEYVGMNTLAGVASSCCSSIPITCSTSAPTLVHRRRRHHRLGTPPLPPPANTPQKHRYADRNPRHRIFSVRCDCTSYLPYLRPDLGRRTGTQPRRHPALLRRGRELHALARDPGNGARTALLGRRRIRSPGTERTDPSCSGTSGSRPRHPAHDDPMLDRLRTFHLRNPTPMERRTEKIGIFAPG